MENERSRDRSSPYKGLRRDTNTNGGSDSKNTANFPKEEFASPTTSKHL
jgi:hypothetical protein